MDGSVPSLLFWKRWRTIRSPGRRSAAVGLAILSRRDWVAFHTAQPSSYIEFTCVPVHAGVGDIRELLIITETSRRHYYHVNKLLDGSVTSGMESTIHRHGHYINIGSHRRPAWCHVTYVQNTRRLYRKEFAHMLETLAADEEEEITAGSSLSQTRLDDCRDCSFAEWARRLTGNLRWSPLSPSRLSDGYFSSVVRAGW